MEFLANPFFTGDQGLICEQDKVRKKRGRKAKRSVELWGDDEAKILKGRVGVSEFRYGSPSVAGNHKSPAVERRMVYGQSPPFHQKKPIQTIPAINRGIPVDINKFYENDNDNESEESEESDYSDNDDDDSCGIDFGSIRIETSNPPPLEISDCDEDDEDDQNLDNPFVATRDRAIFDPTLKVGGGEDQSNFVAANCEKYVKKLCHSLATLKGIIT